MAYKELIKTQLELLKKMGKSRREIEKALKYGDKYIDQALSRGGNESLLNALVAYKQKLEDNPDFEVNNNELNDTGKVYSSSQDIIELQKQVIADLRAEKLKLLEEIEELKMINRRLENNNQNLQANLLEMANKTLSA